MLRHVIGFALGGLSHVRIAGVQDVAEDSGLGPEQLEVAVHSFAKGVLFPVIAEAQLLHGLVPAGAKERVVGLAGLRRRVDGGGTYKERDPAF